MDYLLWKERAPTVKKMNLQKKEKDQLKPNKDGKTDVKFWEYCPFCKLRRKLQREIKKLIKKK